MIEEDKIDWRVWSYLKVLLAYEYVEPIDLNVEFIDDSPFFIIYKS